MAEARGGLGGEYDLHPRRQIDFLRWMAQGSALLRFLDAAIGAQTAVILIIERHQGLRHRVVVSCPKLC
jgi:hypothetical protein